MGVRVTIPQGMRCFTDGDAVVKAADGTVGTVLAELGVRYPALGTRLCDGEGRPNPFVRIFVDEHEINALEGLDTSVQSDMAIHVLAGAAGG